MNNAITEQSSWTKIGVEVIDVLFVQWGAVIYFQIYSVVSQSLEKNQYLLLTNRCHLISWIFTQFSTVVDSSSRHLACFCVMQMRFLGQIPSQG